jgi:hypothetical protein
MQRKNLAVAMRRAARAGEQVAKEERWPGEFPEEFDEANEDGDEDAMLMEYDPTTGEVYD